MTGLFVRPGATQTSPGGRCYEFLIEILKDFYFKKNMLRNQLLIIHLTDRQLKGR